MPGGLGCTDPTHLGNQLMEFGSGQVAPVDDGRTLRQVGSSLTKQARHGNKVRCRISIGIGSEANELGFDNSAVSIQPPINDKNMSWERRSAAGMKINKVARAFTLVFAGQIFRCRSLCSAHGVPS